MSPDGRLLIQKRSEYEGPDWGAFGGHIEVGETPEEAVIRETEEELNIQISSKDIITRGHINAVYADGRICRCHLFLYPTEKTEFQISEGDGAQWCTPLEAKQKANFKAFGEMIDQILEGVGT